MNNVDWTSFGIPSKTQRRILVGVLEVLKSGFGRVEIIVQNGKVLDIIQSKRERLTEEETDEQ